MAVGQMISSALSKGFIIGMIFLVIVIYSLFNCMKNEENISSQTGGRVLQGLTTPAPNPTNDIIEENSPSKTVLPPQESLDQNPTVQEPIVHQPQTLEPKVQEPKIEEREDIQKPEIEEPKVQVTQRQEPEVQVSNNQEPDDPPSPDPNQDRIDAEESKLTGRAKEIFDNIQETHEVIKNSAKFSGRSSFKSTIREMYKDKIETLKDACKRNNIQDTRSLRETHWWFSRKYNFLYCMNPKSGSSTMKRYLVSLLGINFTTHMPELRNYKVYSASAGKKLQSISKSGLDSGLFVFTIVRHPFSHLVSAYWKFASYKESFDNRLNEAFRYHNASTDKPLSPSQMAEFIINRDPWGKSFNHFKPYQKTCNYCEFDFDAIIDVVDLEDRIRLIANNLPIKEWQMPPVLVNSRPKDGNDAEKFFSNITLSMAKRLYEFYRLDFELFGYDPEPYYKYCQKD